MMHFRRVKLSCSVLLVLSVFTASSQVDDSTRVSSLKNLTLSAYFEFYAAVDVDNSNKHQRPYFLYNNTRTGELALNLGIIRAGWINESMRGNIAMMTGTYAERNLATESKVFQHVYEANIGLKLSKRHKLWLDMGIFNSHLGFESAIGKDNPTLTRTISAENSPYYETGAKLSLNSKDDKWLFSFLVLNGWQRIYKLDGNYYPAVGMQINYKMSDKFQFNYSNYLGDESKDEDYGARFFQDLYFTYQPLKRLTLCGAFDYGMQPDFSDDDWPMQYWYGWFAIAKVGLTDKLSVAFRAEQYNDPNEVIVINQYADGFITNGYSLNVDYKIHPNALFRLEGRRLQGKEVTFENRDGNYTNIYDGITACLSVVF